MVEYSSRLMLLQYLKYCCLTTVGFEQAFARVSTEDLNALFYMVEEHTSMHTRYKEYIDFLDGNGFSVEKIADNWYSIKYLYGAEPQ